MLNLTGLIPSGPVAPACAIRRRADGRLSGALDVTPLADPRRFEEVPVEQIEGVIRLLQLPAGNVAGGANAREKVANVIVTPGCQRTIWLEGSEALNPAFVPLRIPGRHPGLPQDSEVAGPDARWETARIGIDDGPFRCHASARSKNRAQEGISTETAQETTMVSIVAPSIIHPLNTLFDLKRETMTTVRQDSEDDEMPWPPKDFTGEWIVEWPNGVVKFKSLYIRGKEEGSYECYWQDGTPAQLGQNDNGVSVGIWKDYRSDGSYFKETEFFDKDTFDVRWLDPSGKVYRVQHFINGHEIKTG